MKLRKITNQWIALAALLCGLTACFGEEPLTDPVTIAVLGDSLTAGYMMPEDQAFPAQLEALFHKNGYTGVRVLNFGETGDTSQGGIRRVASVMGSQPDIVILELGANDLLSQNPAEKTGQNLSAIIAVLKSTNIRVILTGMELPPFISARSENLGDYGAMFSGLATTYQLPFYPHFLKGAIGVSGMMLDDGLHPNAKGVAAIAESIYPLVKTEVRAHLKP